MMFLSELATGRFQASHLLSKSHGIDLSGIWTPSPVLNCTPSPVLKCDSILFLCQHMCFNTYVMVCCGLEALYVVTSCSMILFL